VTVAELACRAETASSGSATVVIAEPTALVDCPIHSSAKFQVRSSPPTGRPGGAAAPLMPDIRPRPGGSPSRFPGGLTAFVARANIYWHAQG
jgi:hypothetical protein